MKKRFSGGLPILVSTQLPMSDIVIGFEGKLPLFIHIDAN